jgi:hypothetical protein
MKNTILGLMAASLIATPAMASWKSDLFGKFDADRSGEITFSELKDAGCRVKPKFFAYADKDSSKGLNKAEYFDSRNLLGKCSK